jgi:hypothetical protein
VTVPTGFEPVHVTEIMYSEPAWSNPTLARAVGPRVTSSAVKP